MLQHEYKSLIDMVGLSHFDEFTLLSLNKNLKTFIDCSVLYCTTHDIKKFYNLCTKYWYEMQNLPSFTDNEKNKLN